MKKIILGFYLADMFHKHKPTLALAAFKHLDKHQPEALHELASRLTRDHASEFPLADVGVCDLDCAPHRDMAFWGVAWFVDNTAQAIYIDQGACASLQR